MLAFRRSVFNRLRLIGLGGHWSCRYSGLGGLCSCRAITFASLRKIQWKTYQVSFEGDLKVEPHPENSTMRKKQGNNHARREKHNL